jgi:hypothetical protein
LWRFPGPDGKIVNALPNNSIAPMPQPTPLRVVADGDGTRITEDEVKEAVRDLLAAQGFAVAVAWGAYPRHLRMMRWFERPQNEPLVLGKAPRLASWNRATHPDQIRSASTSPTPTTWLRARTRRSRSGGRCDWTSASPLAGT